LRRALCARLLLNHRVPAVVSRRTPPVVEEGALRPSRNPGDDEES